MKTAKHKYAPAEYHIIAIAIIAAMIVLTIFVAPYEHDVTGFLLFPALFIGVLLRAVWDWLYVVYTVISQTVKYIFTILNRKAVKHVG